MISPIDTDTEIKKTKNSLRNVLIRPILDNSCFGTRFYEIASKIIENINRDFKVNIKSLESLKSIIDIYGISDTVAAILDVSKNEKKSLRNNLVQKIERIVKDDVRLRRARKNESFLLWVQNKLLFDLKIINKEMDKEITALYKKTKKKLNEDEIDLIRKKSEANPTIKPSTILLGFLNKSYSFDKSADVIVAKYRPVLMLKENYLYNVQTLLRDSLNEKIISYRYRVFNIDKVPEYYKVLLYNVLDKKLVPILLSGENTQSLINAIPDRPINDLEEELNAFIVKYHTEALAKRPLIDFNTETKKDG